MPPKPESEPQPQPELQLTHLPSEIIAQTIEDVMTLREGDGREESLRTTVNRLADNFAMWDAETRKSFMVTMLGKQSETSSGFVDYMDKKEGGYKFPLGVNFEARFLMELPIEMRIETFWDVVREYAWDMDFSKQGDPTPVIMGNFIRSAEKAFGPADWRQIELQLVTSFAQDPNISSDGKYEAVKGYFRRAGLFVSSLQGQRLFRHCG